MDTLWKDLFDRAPLFGLGEPKIEANYLSYSMSECYWSVEPPMILSNGKFHFPVGTYCEPFINSDGSPKFKAQDHTFKIIKRGA